MEDYNLEYDYLILSPGANPFVPPVEGFDKEGVKTLRNVNDMDKIINYIEENNVKNAVVAGGGFIGVEMAENLTERGIRVSLDSTRSRAPLCRNRIAGVQRTR